MNLFFNVVNIKYIETLKKQKKVMLSDLNI